MIRVVCMSHSPLLLHVAPRENELGNGFFAAIESTRRHIINYAPELVVVFAPDHFNGFFYDAMPCFCLGIESSSSPDWGIPQGNLNVPRDIALEMLAAVRAQEVDLAVSYRMTVDHGFTIPLRLLLGHLDAVPTIPVFLNCNAPPLPSCRRSRLLGRAIGTYLRGRPERILVVGSGGLSHDPPHAAFEQAPADIREVLIGAMPRTAEGEVARQRRVLSAAEQLVAGHGPSLPPDREWDRTILDLLIHQRLENADFFSDSWLRKGGSGGHEIRTWIAAFAALSACGAYRTNELYHCIVPDWLTGMAVLEGSPA